MDLLNIRIAFEKALRDLSPEIDSYFPGVPVPTAPSKKPYQRIKFNPFRPLNPTYGDNYYREVGEVLVFLCYPSREGVGKALMKAEQIREFFHRGKTLEQNGTITQIKYTPIIDQETIVEDRLIIPVVIEYFTSVLKV